MSIPRDVIPWYPAINEELCTDCGVCVEFCPHSVYRVDNGRTIVTAPYNCPVGCSNCENLCEPGAIRFPDMAAFAATVRALRAKYGQEGRASPGGERAELLFTGEVKVCAIADVKMRGRRQHE